MILKVSLNIQMIWMIFIKMLKNTIKISNEKYWLYFMIHTIADVLRNRKINPIVIDLFTEGRKLNIAHVTQSFVAVPKNIRLNSTCYFCMKIPNKQELLGFWLLSFRFWKKSFRKNIKTNHDNWLYYNMALTEKQQGHQLHHLVKPININMFQVKKYYLLIKAEWWKKPKILYFLFLKTFNSEFSYIEVWFTDQNSEPLETEDNINITLVII